MDSLLGCVLVDELLRALLSIHVIKGIHLPHRQVRVLLNIDCFGSIFNFAPKVLHNRHAATILAHLNHGQEVVALHFAG